MSKWKYELIETSPSGKKNRKASMSTDKKISSNEIKKGIKMLKMYLYW